MLNFDYANKTRIIFGKGTHKQAGEIIKPYARKVMLIYGGESVKRTGVYFDVVNSLKESGVVFTELGGVVPNPRITKVYEGLKKIKSENVDFLLALGGGSVIDTAKAVAMGAYYDGDAWDIYEKHIMVGKAMPLGVVLTIPAAGSETSNSSVLSNEEKEMKRGCTNNLTRPVFSIINPEIFFTLPKNQISNGIADMMSHIFERYFTYTESTDLIDGICETVLKTIIKNAQKVYDDPTDYDAWCQIGLGGTIAHNDLLGVGRAQDWACHAMEHELSARYDIAHGAGLAILTPAWMKYVYKSNRSMFLQFAVNVMGMAGDFRKPESLIVDAIERLSFFYARIGLPQKMSGLGIDEADFEVMAKRATRAAYGEEKPIGGVQKLTWQDVKSIFELAK